MSGIKYHEGVTFFGLRTAGWFLLGLPMLIGMGLFLALPICFLARKLSPAAGWIVLLAISVPAIINAFYSSLPHQRLESVLGVEIPDETKIHFLVQGDSFNDGVQTAGEFSGSMAILNSIAKKNGLQEKVKPLLFMNRMFEIELPESAKVMTGELMTCYLDPKTDRIYFSARNSLPNP